jgi:hypothetical protein
VWALVVLAVLTTLAAALTFQLLAARRAVDRRERQLQAEWLARSGAELTAARLLEKSAYEGETAEVLAGSKVRIQVQAEKGEPNVYRITCEARQLADGPEAVTRTVTRRFRRTVEGERVRVEGLPPAKGPTP